MGFSVVRENSRTPHPSPKGAYHPGHTTGPTIDLIQAMYINHVEQLFAHVELLEPAAEAWLLEIELNS